VKKKARKVKPKKAKLLKRVLLSPENLIANLRRMGKYQTQGLNLNQKAVGLMPTEAQILLRVAKVTSHLERAR